LVEKMVVSSVDVLDEKMVALKVDQMDASLVDW